VSACLDFVERNPWWSAFALYLVCQSLVYIAAALRGK
jgi:hypothetical protein